MTGGACASAPGSEEERCAHLGPAPAPELGPGPGLDPQWSSWRRMKTWGCSRGGGALPAEGWPGDVHRLPATSVWCPPGPGGRY